MRSTRRGRIGLTREAALYFGLAGAQPSSSGAAAPAPAAVDLRGLDWDRLAALAWRDGTTAAVRRRLLAAGIEPPAATAELLSRQARVLDFHRLDLERALQDALGELERAGLRPVLLKGAAVSRAVYPAPTDRPMSDIDLLLAPEEALEAARVLRDGGWTQVGVEPDAEGRGRYGLHHHLPPLRAPGGSRAVVELHRDVLPAGHPFAWDGAGVIARAVRVPGRAGPVLVPDGADLLVHACVHFAWAHEMRTGAWRAFADVAALMAARGPDGSPLVDADRVLARAAGARARSAVAWTLRLAHRLAGVPIPPALGRLAPSGLAPWLLTRPLAVELVPGGDRAPSVRLTRLVWTQAVRPRASGHGPARPWLLGAGAFERRATPAFVPRAAAQMRRLSAWARYGQRLLGG